MIQNIPGYKYPTPYEIELACEKLGYNLYIPSKLFKDIIILHVYKSRKKEPGYFRPCNDFEIKYIDFLKSLRIFESITPLLGTILLLKDLAHTINFKTIETDSIDFNSCYTLGCNFKQNLEEKQIQQLIALSQETDVHKLASVLELGVKIIGSFSTKSTETKEAQTRMSSVKDLFSVRYSEWLKPLFKHKVITKSFDVEKEIPKSKEDDFLIYCEDNTSSMKNNFKLLAATRWAVLNCKKDVVVYSVTSTVVEMDSITNKNKDTYIFDPVFYKEDCDYKELLKVLNTYDSGEIIIATDGENFVPNVKTKLKINCVTSRSNSRMRNLVKKSGGKYIIL